MPDIDSSADKCALQPRIESAIQDVLNAFDDIVGYEWSKEQAEEMRQALHNLVVAIK